MCRSIKRLREGVAVASEQEIEEAALQYIRKISGFRVPSRVNAEVFQAAVAEVAATSRKLLDSLVIPGRPRASA